MTKHHLPISDRAAVTDYLIDKVNDAWNNPTTPPGDVAMQAADAIWGECVNTEGYHASDVAYDPEKAAAIIQRAIDAVQAPAVCQSDEDVAQAIADSCYDGLTAAEFSNIPPMIARHRLAHEATAWQKGCEYMREAAASTPCPPGSNGNRAVRLRAAIRALPIPPAPTGGRDNG